MTRESSSRPASNVGSGEFASLPLRLGYRKMRLFSCLDRRCEKFHPEQRGRATWSRGGHCPEF